MADPIKISFVFNDQNYHGAYAAHLWNTKKPWIIARSLLCVCMVLFGGLLMIKSRGGGGGKSTDLFGYMFVTAGSVGLLRPMMWQMWHERGIRKHATYGTKMKFLFSEKGIEIDGKKGKFELSWDQVSKVAKAKRGLLIYTSPKKYFWIPESKITDETFEAVSEWSSAKF